MSFTKIITLIGGALAVIAGTVLIVKNINKNNVDPEALLLKDYEKLLNEVTADKTKTNLKSSCDNPQELASKLQGLTDKLSDLQSRKNALTGEEFIPDLPPLPEENQIDDGSKAPDLSDYDTDYGNLVPELPDLSGNNRPGSEVPDLSDYDTEYGTPQTEIPSLPENPGVDRPGSEIPDLSDYDTDYGTPQTEIPYMPEGLPGFIAPNLDDYPGVYVPELPDVDIDTLLSPESDSNTESGSDWIPPLPELETETDSTEETTESTPEMSETRKKIEELEQQIIQALNNLQTVCDEKELEIISDSCEEACQKYKDCAAYGDDVTAQDLQDAYNSCFEECGSWSKETVICINKKPIRVPNDCLNMTRCALPEYGGYIPE